MGQQFTDKAATAFTQALEQDPHLVQAAINKGIALMYLQKLPEAEEALKSALRLAPDNPQAWYNLGLAQHANNETAEALKSFQNAVKYDPYDADSYYFAGVCLSEMKDYAQSIAMFKKALDNQPLHASAEFAMARALQRSGDTPAAREHFVIFRHLSTTKISTPIGLAYGEQGHYSTVLPVEQPQEQQAEMIPVKFEASEIGGNAELHEATGGACMLDATGAGQMDLVLMSDSNKAIRIYHREKDGKFTELNEADLGLQASGDAVACTVGDFDADGLNDLAVAFSDKVMFFRNLGKGKFENVTASVGITAKNKPTGISFIDFDHDGDLDLFLTGAPLQTGGEANVLWRNNGNKTFTEWTEEAALGGTSKTNAAILTDFNNDRAVDIAVTGGSTSPTLYVNPREGKYPAQALYDEKLPESRGITVLDYNKDGWMDIAVTHDGAPGLTLWRNVEGPNHKGRVFVRVQLPLTGVKSAWGVTPIDIDNDGWIDLAAIVETSAGARVVVLRNKGDGTFENISSRLGLDKVHLKAARGLIAADVDGDGAADLIVTQKDAAPVLLRNIGGNKNHSVLLNLIGYADNKTAIGSKVEIYAEGQWQKWELPGASGYATQGPKQLLIGLGKADHIQLLRILWPTGVLQDEIDLPHTPVISMKEADRRGSSCPVLFVWDGHKYKLVTDVIGAGVLGHWFTPTRRNTPNPSEWIKVNGNDIAPVDGKMSIRFIEPMEEVNYIDQLRLVAVDHPENVEVNPDERFLDDPPFASGRVIASAQARLPLGAWDGNGHNVLGVLSHADHTFASGFTPTPYDGFANTHYLTLDLGQVDMSKPLHLLMTGYVNYFSATSLYAAWQAGIKPISPYVEAQLSNGRWERIPGEAGFPAGLERTIVVDLTGKLPSGTQKIRLVSNLEIYWDQVLVDNEPAGEFRTSEMQLTHATEHFRGYPLQIEGKSSGDLNYDYNRVSLTGPFQRQRGNYTRFGDVTPLLKGIDDKFAIFGSGEEIAAEFDTYTLPTLPPHWKRDYFFYANGYVKDMDWWDASPYTVAQLPFHKMSAYPYPKTEKYPDDTDALNYELNFNTRFDSGNPVGSYRFDYESLPSTPAQDRSITKGAAAPPANGSEQ
ncbi:MAG: VCBS repeat-containing protein [Acidobacteriota bacterium]|nr:VCBS repeat-containing protein [Acidobacteriota bacterium]